MNNVSANIVRTAQKGNNTTNMPENSDKHKCNVCDKCFRYKTDLDRHALVHTGEKPFQCPLCCRAFNRKTILKRHMQSKRHGVQPDYLMSEMKNVCDISTIEQSTSERTIFSASSKSGNQKRRHDVFITDMNNFSANIDPTEQKGNDTIIMPENSGKHECNVCNKCFRYKSVLDRHVLVHTGEKPFQCPLCGQAFNRKTILTRHMQSKRHGVQPDYLMSEMKNVSDVSTIEQSTSERTISSASSKSSNQKKRHDDFISDMYNISANIVPTEQKGNDKKNMAENSGQHKCNVCDKCFRYKTDLDRHALVHTGEKPFQCLLCGRAFNRKTILTRHMQSRRHGVQPD